MFNHSSQRNTNTRPTWPALTAQLPFRATQTQTRHRFRPQLDQQGSNKRSHCYRKWKVGGAKQRKAAQSSRNVDTHSKSHQVYATTIFHSSQISFFFSFLWTWSASSHRAVWVSQLFNVIHIQYLMWGPSGLNSEPFNSLRHTTRKKRKKKKM